MECRSCGCNLEEVPPNFEETPQSIHFGKYTCPACFAFVSWAKKPKNENRRTKTSKYEIHDIGPEMCELCRRPRVMLGNNETLHLHHKDLDATNDVKGNLLILCTACHAQVHHNITYLCEHFRHRYADQMGA